MLRSRRFRWRALAVLGWALLFIIIMIGCPICLSLPIQLPITITPIATPTTTPQLPLPQPSLKLSTLIATNNSSSLTTMQQIMPEYIPAINYSCLTGNTSSSNLINNINNYNKCNNNFNKNIMPYLKSQQIIIKNELNKSQMISSTTTATTTSTTTLMPTTLLTKIELNHFNYTTIRYKKLNSIYSKRRRKKLLLTNSNLNLSNFNNNNNNNNNSFNNLNNNLNDNKNIYKKSETVFRINAETLKTLRTHSIHNFSDHNEISTEPNLQLISLQQTTTLEPFDYETSTILQILLSRTDRSIHQSIVGENKEKRIENKKRNKLNSNLDRNERSANLSHISGGSARKIQLYIKNRFIQLMPDGTINGTQDDMSDYTILQRTTVDIGQIKIQGVATCLYLCMDQCGSVYGSKSFTDDCVFNESMEQHHYNTYSSTYNSNSRRTLYLALNRHGEPRKLQIPPSRSLGKLATYTKSLTSAVTDERVEKLISHTFGLNRVKHGLRQLCDGGKPLIELTAKIMKKRLKCNQGITSQLSQTTIIPQSLSLSSSTPLPSPPSPPVTTTITRTPPTTPITSTTSMITVAIPSEKIRLSSNKNSNANISSNGSNGSNSNNSHNSNNNTNNNSNRNNNNSNNNNNNNSMKKKKKKRRCRPDEVDNENCNRGGGPQALKKKNPNQQKFKCNNQNGTITVEECRNNMKKNNNNNLNNNKRNQGHNGQKPNGGLKRNRRVNANGQGDEVSGGGGGGGDPLNVGQHRNRAKNNAVSRSSQLTTTLRHLRHPHTTTTTTTSTTTTIHPIKQLHADHITTTELINNNNNNFNFNNQYQQDDDDLSNEDNDDDHTTSLPSILAAHHAQFIGDDASAYDDDFDLFGVQLWTLLVIFWISSWSLRML